MKIISKFADFIVPRFCTSCDVQLNHTSHFICATCLSQIKLLSKTEINDEYIRKFQNTDFVDDYTSLYVFEESGKLQDLIHALKYNQKFKIGIFLGKLVAKEKKELILNWNVDIIIPVPLFHLKKVERGYNQADYIAKGISQIIGIQNNTVVAKRIKDTLTQTKLDKFERRENMQDAFYVKNLKLIRGKNVIITDDVITTGITILELAKKLKESGAKKVFALSVATPLVSHSVRSRNT